MSTRTARSLSRALWLSVLVGLGVSIVAFLVMGIPTALVRTPFFFRMTPTGPLDYLFLTLTSLLVGAFAALHFYGRQAAATHRGEYATVGGLLGGILAFGCPICNKILVALLGVSAVLTYIDPYRPLIGTLSVATMGAAVYFKAKALRSCTTCPVPNAHQAGETG